MKRQIALFTALLLVLGCVSPALAAEEAPGLYQQYGPWGEWTQEQKDAAEENWTEAQWSDYWAEYDTGLERRVAVRRGLRSVELRPL